MTIAIDETTNLPALPENWFWRIEDHFIGSHGERVNVDTLYVRLIRSKTVTNKYKQAFGRFTHETETFEYEISSRRLVAYAFASIESQKKGLEAIGYKATGHGSYEEPLGLQMAKPLDITQSSISYIATEIVKAHRKKSYKEAHEDIEKEKAEEHRKKFLGDYPPKKLGDK